MVRDLKHRGIGVKGTQKHAPEASGAKTSAENFAHHGKGISKGRLGTLATRVALLRRVYEICFL